mmetsp:Transcript_59820/g.163951  ORF Transcript_59820/g.163951 Transcript_59820/m.163951 type:complete len:306 (-) Transcript_59820:15-932(-)
MKQLACWASAESENVNAYAAHRCLRSGDPFLPHTSRAPTTRHPRGAPRIETYNRPGVSSWPPGSGPRQPPEQSNTAEHLHTATPPPPQQLLLLLEARRALRRSLGEDLLLDVQPLLEGALRLAPLAHEPHHAQDVVPRAGEERSEREEARRLLALGLHARTHPDRVRLALWHVRHCRSARPDPLAVDAHLARAALALAALVLDELARLRRDIAERLAQYGHRARRVVTLREFDRDRAGQPDGRRALVGRAALHLCECLALRPVLHGHGDVPPPVHGDGACGRCGRAERGGARQGHRQQAELHRTE